MLSSGSKQQLDERRETFMVKKATSVEKPSKIPETNMSSRTNIESITTLDNPLKLPLNDPVSMDISMGKLAVAKASSKESSDKSLNDIHKEQALQHSNHNSKEDRSRWGNNIATEYKMQSPKDIHTKHEFNNEGEQKTTVSDLKKHITFADKDFVTSFIEDKEKRDQERLSRENNIEHEQPFCDEKQPKRMKISHDKKILSNGSISKFILIIT